MANFCSNCGEKFSIQNPKFCPICGEPQIHDRSSSDSVVTPSQVDDFNPFTWNFTPVTQEGIVEGARTFLAANKLMVDLQASTWISENTMSEREILDAADSKFSSDSDEEKINIDFTHLNKSLTGFEPIRWADSPFGQRFISILTDLNVTFVNHQFGAVLSFTDENGVEQQDFAKDPIDLVLGTWGTSDGLPFPQIGRIYKSTITGEELIYWHIEALVRTRYAAKDRLPHFSNLIRIPSLLQNFFYLCETPFPSSMVTMPRSMAYGVDFEQIPRIPRPLIQIEEDARAIYIDINNIGQANTYFAPELTRLGYVIKDDLSDDELRTYIPGMFDTLMQIPNLILDGFSNHDFDAELSFQARLGADIAFVEELLHAECGWIVPAMIYGALCERSNRRYNEIYPLLKQAIEVKNVEDLDRVIDSFIELTVLAVGEIFGHTVNTLAFTVINEKQSASEDFAKMIDYASQYPVDYQDLNALSNLANFQIKMGRIDLAEEAIDRAIPKVETGFMGVINQTNSMLFSDSNANEAIDCEVYETYFLIKSQLGKIAECKAIAEKAKAFAEKVSGAENLLATAKSYLISGGIN